MACLEPMLPATLLLRKRPMGSIVMLLKPTSPIEFWTTVLALGTIALSIVAYRGLRSLALAKADIVTRARRDARECAILRCEELAQKILPINGAILGSLTASKIGGFMVNAPEQVSLEPDNQQHLASATKWLQALPPELHVRCIEFVNRLEAWAMYFTKGVADHEIAFGPCAPVYCQFIVQYYPVLLARRASKTSGKFPNTVALFKSWHGVLKHETTLTDLMKKVEQLQRDRAGGKPLPPPLGTEVDG